MQIRPVHRLWDSPGCLGPTFLDPATLFQTAPGLHSGGWSGAAAGRDTGLQWEPQASLPSTRLMTCWFMPFQEVASPRTEMSWGGLLGCKAGGAKTTEPLPLSLRGHFSLLSNPGSPLHQNHRGNLCPGFAGGHSAAWSGHVKSLCLRHAEKPKSHLERRKCISYSSLRALVIYALRIYTGHVPIYIAVL